MLLIILHCITKALYVPILPWGSIDAGVFFNMGSLSTKQLHVEGADQDLILKSFNLNIGNGVNNQSITTHF